MDYYNKLSKTTYNVLGGKDREKIISGIEEHKRIFLLSKKEISDLSQTLKGKKMNMSWRSIAL
jgi:hypothetical protein